MSLLGELHENENLSNSWKWERASKKNDASSEAIPPIFQEQAVPSCPKPRMWSNLEVVPRSPRRHHDKIPTRASPGKAANGRDGCRHHDKKPTRASLGKAVNGRDGSCRHHEKISNACPGEASHGKGISDHCAGHHNDNPPNASPGKASNGRRSKNHSHSCDGSPSGRMLKRLREGADRHPSPPLPTQLDEEDADEHAPGREIDAPPKIWPEK